MVDIVVKYCAGQQNSYVQRVKNITGIHQWLNTDLTALTACLCISSLSRTKLMGSCTTLNIIPNNIESCLCHNTSHHLTNPDGPNSRELVQSNELACQKGERISGERNVVHIRLSNKAFTPQSSSEATRNYKHILRKPWASIPEGLAAPTVWRAAAQTVISLGLPCITWTRV